ncbi:diacylglycerol/lipid kinase family protein [Pseudoduganella sp. UC29_71]|uniref:diacylglycerol/lipid kinase family protein n=1 Tax=Pseudoduganella sp. UC29_71 TaxID=3350174 RepID=UPI00366B0D11
MAGVVPVIINAGAGLGYCGDFSQQLLAKFAAYGYVADITLAQSGEEMIAAAKAAVQAGARLVVAGGGDGTINAVASVLVGTDVAYGVLPLGTLNHFAKDLKIPLDLDQAIAAIATGGHVRVDVGEVNGRIFLNNSSLGLYPDIVRDREKQQSRLGRGKWLAFAWAALTALRRFPFMDVRLSVNGEAHARRTPFVFIGNNEYRMQGLNIGARERIDSGMLSLYVAQRPSRLGLVRLAWHALLGTLAQQRDFDVLLATELRIETRKTRNTLIRVATDGEVTVMQAPLSYRMRAGALTVVVPK